MNYGYVRVSTWEQNEDRQLLALHDIAVLDCASMDLRSVAFPGQLQAGFIFMQFLRINYI